MKKPVSMKKILDVYFEETDIQKIDMSLEYTNESVNDLVDSVGKCQSDAITNAISAISELHGLEDEVAAMRFNSGDSQVVRDMEDKVVSIRSNIRDITKSFVRDCMCTETLIDVTDRDAVMKEKEDKIRDDVLKFMKHGRKPLK